MLSLPCSQDEALACGRPSTCAQNPPKRVSRAWQLCRQAISDLYGRCWPVGDGQFLRTCQLSLRDPKPSSISGRFRVMAYALRPRDIDAREKGTPA
jgi:hypothetical protein